MAFGITTKEFEWNKLINVPWNPVTTQIGHNMTSVIEYPVSIGFGKGSMLKQTEVNWGGGGNL